MAQKSIQQVILTNFKKHKHLALDIKGNSFILQCKNKGGKSSVLQAIDHMVRNAELPEDAVTEGEDSGEIEIILAANGDTYKVSRKLLKNRLGRYELRKDAGNGRYDTLAPAQERFQEIFGNVLDLSPLIDMTGKEQVQMIQQVIGKGGGVQEYIDTVQANVKKLREERLLTGREVKDYEAKMQVPEFRALVNYVDEPLVDLEAIKAKLVDIGDLFDKKSKADTINNYADEQILKLSTIRVDDAEINDLLKKLILAFEMKKVDTASLIRKISEVDSINAAVEEELEQARRRNANIEKSKEFKAVKEAIAEKKLAYENYTLEIKAQLGSISAALSQLGLSEIYPGLSLVYEMDEDGKVTKEGLFLNGHPFNRLQQSYAEMVHALIALSKSINPDGFNFVKIGDWNLMDDETQDAILKLAEANDIQLGIEKVDNNKELVLQLIEK